MSLGWFVAFFLLGLGFIAWFMTAVLRAWSRASVSTMLRAEAKLGGRLALSVELVPSGMERPTALPEAEETESLEK